ncbi:hypothetical protein IE077_002233 [Cardiosporidium cionae]|uniref:Uncharacterized protein n=1 Tax=Cardiosporidium cionae TaxID=476202 RepID=A0ABQ7JFY8_9APIC|nr:hypothetical protein IE077_002233 [Cardiosporidium cionae]|eukprot:KAF8822898.1 hypothetical protein IE077_002233 [Cardiosporidium cionae]
MQPPFIDESCGFRDELAAIIAQKTGFVPVDSLLGMMEELSTICHAIRAASIVDLPATINADYIHCWLEENCLPVCELRDIYTMASHELVIDSLSSFTIKDAIERGGAFVRNFMQDQTTRNVLKESVDDRYGSIEIVKDGVVLSFRIELRELCIPTKFFEEKGYTIRVASLLVDGIPNQMAVTWILFLKEAIAVSPFTMYPFHNGGQSLPFYEEHASSGPSLEGDFSYRAFDESLSHLNGHSNLLHLDPTASMTGSNSFPFARRDISPPGSRVFPSLNEGSGFGSLDSSFLALIDSKDPNDGELQNDFSALDSQFVQLDGTVCDQTSLTVQNLHTKSFFNDPTVCNTNSYLESNNGLISLMSMPLSECKNFTNTPYPSSTVDSLSFLNSKAIEDTRLQYTLYDPFQSVQCTCDGATSEQPKSPENFLSTESGSRVSSVGESLTCSFSSNSSEVMLGNTFPENGNASVNTKQLLTASKLQEMPSCMAEKLNLNNTLLDGSASRTSVVGTFPHEKSATFAVVQSTSVSVDVDDYQKLSTVKDELFTDWELTDDASDAYSTLTDSPLLGLDSMFSRGFSQRGVMWDLMQRFRIIGYYSGEKKYVQKLVSAKGPHKTANWLRASHRKARQLCHKLRKNGNVTVSSWRIIKKSPKSKSFVKKSDYLTHTFEPANFPSAETQRCPSPEAIRPPPVCIPLEQPSKPSVSPTLVKPSSLTPEGEHRKRVGRPAKNGSYTTSTIYTGIYECAIQGRLYIRAMWTDPKTRSRCQKYFKQEDHGREKAIELAKECREAGLRCNGNAKKQEDPSLHASWPTPTKKAFKKSMATSNSFSLDVNSLPTNERVREYHNTGEQCQFWQGNNDFSNVSHYSEERPYCYPSGAIPIANGMIHGNDHYLYVLNPQEPNVSFPMTSMTPSNLATSPSCRVPSLPRTGGVETDGIFLGDNSKYSACTFQSTDTGSTSALYEPLAVTAPFSVSNPKVQEIVRSPPMEFYNSYITNASDSTFSADGEDSTLLDSAIMPAARNSPLRIYPVVMCTRRYWRVEWLSTNTGKRVYKHFGENRFGVEQSKRAAYEFYNDLHAIALNSDKQGSIDGVCDSQNIVKSVAGPDENTESCPFSTNDSFHLQNRFLLKNTASPTRPSLLNLHEMGESPQQNWNDLPFPSSNTFNKSEILWSSSLNAWVVKWMLSGMERHEIFQAEKYGSPANAEVKAVEFCNSLNCGCVEEACVTLPRNLPMGMIPASDEMHSESFADFPVSPSSVETLRNKEPKYSNRRYSSIYRNKRAISSSKPVEKGNFVSQPFQVRPGQRVPGRIYRLNIRNVQCWRAEWNLKPSGKRRTRQFAETVHGTKKARLNALQVLIENDCVPNNLLEEAREKFGYERSPDSPLDSSANLSTDPKSPSNSSSRVMTDQHAYSTTETPLRQLNFEEANNSKSEAVLPDSLYVQESMANSQLDSNDIHRWDMWNSEKNYWEDPWQDGVNKKFSNNDSFDPNIPCPDTTSSHTMPFCGGLTNSNPLYPDPVPELCKINMSRYPVTSTPKRRLCNSSFLSESTGDGNHPDTYPLNSSLQDMPAKMEAPPAVQSAFAHLRNLSSNSFHK